MGSCIRHRDIFLRIERIGGYSPLAPEACSRRWGRDAMFNTGHELGRVQPSEIVSSTVDALVYREYLDGHYTVPNTAKLIDADVNEPPWERRVPGALLFAVPGERLRIHVLNGDPDECHSFHLHGLRYGIDSDGAWPFGLRGRSGRRSDEIRPGETWTYVFDATNETIGAWAFHDHVRGVQRNVNRGLFGGLIVRDPASPCADHEIPVFVHQMQSAITGESFESPTMHHAGAPFEHTFAEAGTFNYHCKIHGVTMAGVVSVDPAAPPGDRAVTIGDNFFNPPAVALRPGRKVTWTNTGQFDHIVFAPGGGGATFCLNGRAYVGNTPTIEAESGERLRWYLLNLDLGSTWHNFHPHATRWQLPAPPGGAADVHPLSPAQSFVADTEVPEAVRLPCRLEDLQCDPPDGACRVRVRGDFLFHCHLEEHMMAGLAGLLRARKWIWVTDQALADAGLDLPYDDRGNEIGWVDLARCGRPCPSGRHDHDHERTRHQVAGHGHEPAHDHHRDDGDDHDHGARPDPAPPMPGMGAMVQGAPALDLCKAAEEGVWELLPCDSRVLAVHAVLMHTGRVLFFAGSGNNVPHWQAKDTRSVVWDYAAGTFHTPVTPFDVFCAGQTVLADGKVLVAGGTKRYDPFIGLRSTWLFDPQLEEWIKVGDMSYERWYPSLVTLGDGRAVAVSGIAAPSEVWTESSGWSTLPHATDLPLFPHLFLLGTGRLFFTGGQFGQAVIDARTVNTFTAAETLVPGLRDQGNRDEAFSVLLPPAQQQRVMVIGGGGPAQATAHTDIVDLRTSSPAYTPGPDLNRARGLHNAVILPDRTVFVSGGGLRGETRADAVHLAEIYDPVANVFRKAAEATVSRLYHSIALLLPDGRVIAAGSNPDRGDDELRLELFHPPYLFKGPRPFIQACPSEWSYGSTVPIHTPQARRIRWAHLIRPMAVTHSDDTSQRLVDLPIAERDLCHLHVRVTRNPNMAPPGWYMLFLCDSDGVPSVAKWIHLAGASAGRPIQLNERVLRTHLSHGHLHVPGFPIPGFPVVGDGE